MGNTDSLGDRMKQYEATSKHFLIRKIPVIVRVDGKAFHTWVKNITDEIDPSLLTGPFSDLMHNAMMYAQTQTMQQMQNVKLAYTQSDEISFLLLDRNKITTSQWFDGNLQKIASVTASLVTANFCQILTRKEPRMMERITFPAFDARVFQLPDHEVVNYFIWRQKDATRNSISMLGRFYFSHKALHKATTSDVQDMLMEEHNVNWNDLLTWQKRGTCAIRKIVEVPTHMKVGRDTPALDIDYTLRSVVALDDEIPIFTQDRDYIDRIVENE